MRYELLKKILNSRITILDYLILEHIKNETCNDFFNDKDFFKHFEYLKQNELISNNNKLTLKGKVLIDELNQFEEKGEYYSQLHKSLQDELVNLTGKKQKMLQNKYGFIPTANDLKLRLQKVIKKYNLEDEKKVKEVLISYVKRCVKARFEYVQTIGYYILKDGMSNFATDYENYADTKQDEQDEFTGINV